MAKEEFKSTGGKREPEQSKGEGGVYQIRLYPQNGLMVIHDKGLSDKEQGQEIKEKEGARGD